MSTRANIIITDGYDELVFYRHSDGYPKGTMPTLEKFIGYVKDGVIRDNVSQASGWLILLGAEEYSAYYEPRGYAAKYHNANPCIPTNWKCGAYEPATAIHGDIDFLYVVDLREKTITVYDGEVPYVGKFGKF